MVGSSAQETTLLTLRKVYKNYSVHKASMHIILVLSLSNYYLIHSGIKDNYPSATLTKSMVKFTINVNSSKV